MNLLYNRWSVCVIAIFLTSVSIISLFIFDSSIYLKLFLVIISLFGIYNSILETYVAITFISPGKVKASLDHEDWDLIRLVHKGPEVIVFRNLRLEKAPLILMIHGWRSSSSSMLGRAEIYLKRGFHVAIMELPGHGSAEGVKKWNAGVPVRNLIHLFQNLDKICDISLISKIYFHGHSMGGFVFLRFSREISNQEHSDLVEGYILESPLTCYSEIFEESCRMLFVPKFVKPLFWNRLKFHFNAINPGFEKISSTMDVDVPIWGLPSKPTLVVQAANDERLGQIHHRNLVDAFNNTGNSELLSDIVIDDLTHAGARNNSNRDNAIEQWLDAN